MEMKSMEHHFTWITIIVYLTEKKKKNPPTISPTGKSGQSVTPTNFPQRNTLSKVTPSPLFELIFTFANSALCSTQVSLFPEEEGLKREELFLYEHIEIIPIEAKTQISIYIKKNKFNLEIFQCFHQVPSGGYWVSEVRKKLKEEYTKLSGREIGELRKNAI